ncbi:Protein Nynrin [Manis pentadactyla]|nr:Protein Nynrin [Manis pentadactyla]
MESRRKGLATAQRAPSPRAGILLRYTMQGLNQMTEGQKIPQAEHTPRAENVLHGHHFDYMSVVLTS